MPIYRDQDSSINYYNINSKFLERDSYTNRTPKLTEFLKN